MRSILKSKKGQGHVEIIIAFIIFLGFVTVMLYFLNPLRARSITSTFIDITEDKLLEEWQIEYKTISLTLSPNADDEGCFKVKNPGLNISGNLVVKDQGMTIKNSGMNPGKNHFWTEFSPGMRYYVLYFSEGFTGGTLSSCSRTLPEANYSFGSLNKYNTILYENILDFKEEYENDYEGLRQRLDLQNDFTFSVYDQSDLSTPIVEVEKFTPRYVEIRARNIPIVAIDSNAELMRLVLNIRAWA